MPTFRLDVQLIERSCLFKLSDATEQPLPPVTLSYSGSLTALYEDWRRAYLNFYQSAQISTDATATAELNGWLPHHKGQQLRGRLEESGSMAPSQIDWHEQLRNAEAKLLHEFNYWLQSAELHKIRAKVTYAARRASEQSDDSGRVAYVDVLLACHTPELARFPWEAWEIGDEFVAPGVIRLARVPDTEVKPVSVANRNRRWRPRVLAIWGDDSGLNFQVDRDAVQALSRIAEIKSISWQRGQTIAAFKEQICSAIADLQGWDVLFFAGHSDETELTGGKLMLAPGESLLISDIEYYLQTAKARGLQFAIFNSCSGISIAESLISKIGLSQVAVMRQPIHNQVAQEFLVQFLRSLAAHQDVHESLLTACQYLDRKKYTYPCAYLIPSLFRHPDPNVPLFKIEPRWKQWLKQLKPNRQQAIALTLLLCLSWSLDVQDWLLDRRVLIQAIYRQLTAQIPTAPPNILLVQIDELSIQKAQISHPRPMERKYLASLVDKLNLLDARVVGIDYLLDRSHGESDRILAQSLQAAVQKTPQPTWFVFASVRSNGEEWLSVLPEIASPTWSLQGHIHLSHWYVGLLPQKPAAAFELPFDYALALAYRLNVESLPITEGQNLAVVDKLPVKPNLNTSVTSVSGRQSVASFSSFPYPPQPQLHSQTNLISQVTSYLKSEKGQDYKTLFSPLSQLQPLTSFSYDLGQMWLHPMIDLSIPPDKIYNRIPAWQLLKSDANYSQLDHISQQVVIIAPGEYGEAGVSRDGQDNFSFPAAFSYWLNQGRSSPHSHFTGAEAHAYVVHHFLNKRLVVPIPDLWMIWLAILLGKGMLLVKMRNGANSEEAALLKHHFTKVSLQRRAWVMLLGGTAVYGLASLQVYISAGVLLPWFLPSVTLWTYALPMLLRKNSHA